MPPRRHDISRRAGDRPPSHVLTAYAATVGDGRILLWRCVVLYPVLVAALAVLLQTETAQSAFVRPSNVLTAHVGAWLIALTGQDVSVSGALIAYGGQTARVGTGCSGAELLMVLLPAIVVFPGTLRAKVVGAAAALVFVFSLNAVRIGTLSVLLATDTHLFELAHLYFWQALLIAALVGFFLAWLEVTRRYSTPARSA